MGAKAGERGIIAAHAAVMTILAAVIGNLNNSSQKDGTPEIFGCSFPCGGMQVFLGLSANREQLGTNTRMIVHVRRQLRVSKTLSQMKFAGGREIIRDFMASQARLRKHPPAIRVNAR